MNIEMRLEKVWDALKDSNKLIKNMHKHGYTWRDLTDREKEILLIHYENQGKQ